MLMEPVTIITMILVSGLIWGGFAFFLSRAVKYERIKEQNGEV